MKGRRRGDVPDGELPQDAERGDFWWSAGEWWAMVPNGAFVCLRGWGVEEHPDRTITVSPSILVHGHTTVEGDDGTVVERPEWHGYLTAGVWREV